MKKRLRWTLSLTAVLLLNAAGNLASGQVAQSNPGEWEKALEGNLTWNLQNALAQYFPEDKFVIKADVELQPNSPRRTLPPLPEALLKRGISRLPGLPLMPETLKNSLKPPAEGVPTGGLQKRSMALRRTRINVLVDQEFPDRDLRFIRRLISLTAGLNPARGDVIRVERMPFPVKSPTVPPPPAQKAPRDNLKAIPSTKVHQAQIDWLPLIFMAGLALLLLVLFLWGMHMLIKNLKPVLGSSLVPVRSKSLHPTKPKPRPAPQPAKSGAKEAAERDRLKSLAIEAMVGTPAAAARVLQKWLHHDPQHGLHEAALVLAATSKSLIELLAPHLGPEAAGNLQLAIDRLQPREIEATQNQALAKFERDLRQMALQARNKNEEDALAFLYQMSDDQLLHLIKPLKKGVKAIVLAQLHPDRAAKLLRTFDPKEQKRVLAAMANIEQVPADVYRHIARQLAARARELQTMRFVKADGIESLVEILEQMDDQAQQAFLDFLQTQDIRLAEKVRNRFLRFQDLLELPPEQLRRLALNVDKDLLAKSLVTVDDATVHRIIQSLPDRLAEMVRADLETLQNIPQAEIATARRKLVHAAKSGA